MKYYLIILFCFCLTACSNKKQGSSEAGFDIKLGLSANNTNSLAGGVTLYAQSLDPLVPDFSIDLTENLTAEIPFGEYNILLVGWHGPDQWQGTTYCGSVILLLNTPTQSVNITLDQTNCTLGAYSGIIASKGGTVASTSTWDSGIWGTTTWQP